MPEQLMGKPVETGKLEKFLAGELDEKPVEKKENSIISSSQDYWTISDVNYRGKIWNIDLSKSLLDNGNAKTQDEWAEYSKQAKQNNEFYVGDMPLYYAVFTALFNQKDKPESQEARDFIQEQMREKWLMTLTRIAYQPKGKDKIIHNYNLLDEYKIRENMVGEDKFIESGDGLALNAILGTDNINEINQVYQFINGTKGYIWRLNFKPKNIDERVARFSADSDGAGLDCYRIPEGSGGLLGVRGCAEGTQKN